MRLFARLCTAAASTALIATAGAVLAPMAGAATPDFDSAAIVNQVREELGKLGVATPEVDPALTETIDSAVEAAPAPVREQIAAVTSQASQAGQAAQEYLDAAASGPNYHWSSNPVDQVLAGKLPLPGQDAVLHRVPGSYFDAPRVPQAAMDAQARGKSLFGAGTPLYLGQSSMCTLAAVGHDASGRAIGITAGHCGNVGDQVLSADSWEIGPAGTVVATDAAKDYGIIEFGSNAELTNNYNGVWVAGAGNYTAHTGTTVCKDGVATGHTCGMVLTTGEQMMLSQVCAMPGDSGAPVTAAGRVVGVVNGGSLPFAQLACQSPLQGLLFMPTVMTPMDTILADLHVGDQSRPGGGFTGI